jgi:dTDP-4-dehydrorhamnose reductase
MNPEIPSILVIGARGQVGWELLRTLAPLGRVVSADRHGGDLVVDLADTASIVERLAPVRAKLIVNAAAYTAVDKAESEAQLAQRINADALAELGRLASADGVPVLHYSTDFVFDGNAKRPYREDDAPGPLNVYGETKLAGEQALAASGAAHLVFRTAWVYGGRGSNFMLTMQRLAAEREELRVVDDQVGSPTWSRMLAEATAQIAGRLLSGALDAAEVSGTYHMTAGGSTSWYGFARAILDAGDAKCRLTPIPSAGYPTPARRPAYSVLDNGKLQQRFGIRLPNWQDSLEQCLQGLR